MAEMWRSKSTEVLKDWVQTIIDEASDDLNAWELKFISDMETKLANGWFITQAQQEKLESIYAEKTK